MRLLPPFLLLLSSLAWSVPPARAAVPPAVLAQMRAADDHPAQALAAMVERLREARSRADTEAAFWWALMAARVHSRLERGNEASLMARQASGLLAGLADPDGERAMWLRLAELDASSGMSDDRELLAPVTALRAQAQAQGRAQLACEAIGLELWLLQSLESQDEAWSAAEEMERCGQALKWPELIANSQLAFGMLARLRVIEGRQDERPERFFSKAEAALGNLPARFMRSLIDWETGIGLRAQGQLEPALERLTRARDLSLELQDDAGVAAAQLEMVSVLLKLKRPAPTLALLQEAERRLALGGDGEQALRRSTLLEMRVRALAQLGSPLVSDAISQARRHLVKETSPRTRSQVLEAIALGLASQGRHAEAFESLKASVESDRQARVLARDTQVLRLQARYDLARREAENAELSLRSETARRELEAESDRRRTLTAGLVALAAVSILALSFGGRELARRRRMAALALRDHLTGLPNRRAVQAYAEAQWELAHRLSLPFAVALIDFDHFKQVNDRHGHAVGDAVLRAFAEAASSVLRGQDRLGRWGGEEWLLVMPGTRLSEIDAVFQRISQRFASTAVPGLSPDERCTFSMGAADLSSGHSTLAAMIDAADQALFAAKRGGRDRVEIALPKAA